ncbi:MAG TPA: GGDEF domain-containing protein [Solirubrobacteraceae bacterium]|nr:GGDEF domain-containing protein [Solirubrobacteraceae bacterium]
MSNWARKLEVLIRADLGRYAHAQTGETRARFPEEASADAVGAWRRNGTTLASATKFEEAQARGLANAERPLLDLLVANFARILNSEVVLYYQLGSTGQLLPVISSCGRADCHERITRSQAGGIVGRALVAKRAALEPLDHDHDIALVDSACEVRLTHATAARVGLAHRTVGVLAAGFSALPPDTAHTLWGIESCASTLGLGLDQPGALSALLQVDRHDMLTGCLTYAAARHELDREINRSARATLPLSLCFIDLDRFKRINDQHGHLCGNEALAQVGRVLRDSVRSCDLVGRFGGDEFLAVLPETNEPDARQLARRLQSQIAAATIKSTGERLTASIGTAQWVPGTTAEQLLTHADHALHLAKARADHPDALNGQHAYGLPGAIQPINVRRRRWTSSR